MASFHSVKNHTIKNTNSSDSINSQIPQENKANANSTHSANDTKKANLTHTRNNTQSKADTTPKDNSATRILLIIKALVSGKDLAELSLKDFDFNISQRTFQRDIKKIKDFFADDSANLQGGGGYQKHTKVRCA